MNTPSTTQELIGKLNEYRGRNYWQDIVSQYALDDRSFESDTSPIVLYGGDRVWFSEGRQCWVAV